MTTTNPPANLTIDRITLWRFFSRYGSLVVLAGLVVTFSVADPESFLDVNNFVNILNQSALTAIIAMGLTFPLVSGDFDLSIGYSASLGGLVAAALTASWGWPFLPAALFAIGIGAAVGLINGFLVARVGINAMIATLGIGTIVLGVNYSIGGGAPVTITDPTYLDFSFSRYLGIPIPVYVMAAVALILWVLLNRTVLGFQIQATGGNSTAAEHSGIRIQRVRAVCFVIAGMCAALTGVLLAAQSGSATIDGGQAYLLSAFAAAFFGSTVLRDGQFHIVGTLVGVLTVAIGFNGISILGIEAFYQYLFQGGLLIFAVGLGAVARRMS